MRQSYCSLKYWLNSHKTIGNVFSRYLNDNIGNIVLDSPDYHNSLDGCMMSKLDDCLLEFEKKPPKCLILSSNKGSFCSGGNLNFVKTIADSNSGYKMCTFMQWITKRIGNLPSISVAVLEGVAYGGGAELALSCDMRFMAADAKIGFKQRNIGVTPGWGGSPLLFEVLGRQKALQFLLSGQTIHCDEALKLGLADVQLMKPVELRLDESVEILTELTKDISMDLVYAIKKLKNTSGITDFNKHLNHERNIFKTVWGGKDQLEVISKINKK